ncbi:hypothetical protein [Saccharothrix deserti]|uniref:hypothetical protein n=1 Tax=Saccharothrix deserti TaxID=2593674 RepID=UPI00131E3B8F|nr:hypothetical protein [Saccharothrix deserti]
MSDAVGGQTRAQLLLALRTAILLVSVAVVCGLGLANLVRHLGSHEFPLAQVGAFAALAAVLAVEAVLLVRRRPWGRLRLPAVAVVLAASVLSAATLPDGRTASGVDWVFGAANWVGLVVLLDRPLRTVVAFLSAHELIAALNLVLFDDVDKGDLARLATGSVNVIGFPLCVAVVAAVLNRLAAEAAAAGAEIERVRTEEAVTAESHRRRQQRFAELADGTIPLLAGLADGSLNPEDASVQRRSAIEAARMRRLCAETDVVTNPLLHELRHCADVADRKGVVVELEARGHWPTPPVTVRRDLTDAALTALATAASWARVTVVGDHELVSVNVVADCGEVEPPRPATPGVRVEVLGNGETVWMEARWQPTT